MPAIVAALSGFGCSASHAREVPPIDAGGFARDAAADGEVDAPDATENERCKRELTEAECGGTGLDHLGYSAGAASQPYRCYLVGLGNCSAEPPPFATLADCVATCEPDADPRATACERPGEDDYPECELDALAEVASLDGRTPYGAFSFNYAWLGRTIGFSNSVSVIFTVQPEALFSATPRVVVALHDPFGRRGGGDLVGSHDLRIELSLCDDRWIDLPARVTITRDELVPRISERFEGRIESLDASVELAGEFSFSRVCLYSFPE